MTVTVSSSTTLPSYITFTAVDRTFTINSPNTANLNDIVTLQYELSDGYNTTSHTTEVLFSLNPTPTITSTISDISVKVGETITMPITLSSDFFASDTINVQSYEFDWTLYKMQFEAVPSYIAFIQTSPTTYNLTFTPPYSLWSFDMYPSLRIIKGSTLSTKTYIFTLSIINDEPVEDAGFSFTT